MSIETLKSRLPGYAKDIQLNLGSLAAEPTLSADFSGRSFQVGVGDRIDAVEKRLILATVQHTQTKEAAAEILVISVKTLYNRLRAYETRAGEPSVSSGARSAVSAP